MNAETKALLNEVAREIDYTLARHRSASNEVAAAIACEAWADACAEWGIRRDDADSFFRRHFPTLALYK